MSHSGMPDGVASAIWQMLVDETAALVASGGARLVRDNDSYELSPRSAGACAVSLYLQSDEEVSLWPTAPGTDRAPTVDVYSKDPAALVEEVRQYVRAIIAGRVELTLREGSSAGRCRFWLADGSVRTHLYNVVLGFRVGRGSGWEAFRPQPYR